MQFTSRRRKSRLIPLCFSICAFIAVLATATASVSAVASRDLSEQANQALSLLASEIVTLDVASDVGAPLAVTIPIGGLDFTLDLTPHSARDADYRVLVQGADGGYTEVAAQPVNTYRGTVLEAPGSVVAASLLDDGLYARIIFDDDQEYWVEPLAKHVPAAAPNQYVVYHRDDIIPTGASCGADAISHPLTDDGGGFGGRTACGSGGVLCVAELAIDADYQYYQDWGSVAAVENRVNTVINSVNVQYERDVSITHSIVTIIVRTSSGSNPYTTNDASTLLTQFRNYWISNHGDIQRDMAELFTGRNLTGSTIGIAWISAVCSSYGYSVVESDCCGSLSCSSDLSAHEMGHNWGADHCSCSTYTMNASLTCSNRFHPTATIPEIESYRNSHQGCLDADSGCNVTFTGQPADQTTCEGDTAVVTVTVDDAYLMTYQWRKGTTNLVDDGSHIVGATTATLAIVGFTAADEASDYNCVVTNSLESCSETSDNAQLLVETQVPNILSQPQDLTVTEGDAANFVVTVENGALMSYQWRFNGSALSDGGRISGATTQVLSISPTQLGDAGDYDCVITHQLGAQCSTTSDSATLTVNSGGDNCPEDLSGDGSVGLDDLGILLDAYGSCSGDPGFNADADFDASGCIDLGDLGQLLDVYGLDCPTQ